LAGAMGEDVLMQAVQDILRLQPPGLHRGQNSLHEATAVRPPAPETPPAPQHRWTRQPLHAVVRRFHSLRRHERPERRLQCQHVLAELYRRWVAAEDRALRTTAARSWNCWCRAGLPTRRRGVPTRRCARCVRSILGALKRPYHDCRSRLSAQLRYHANSAGRLRRM
jgi:hypothetical protein